MIKTQKLFYVAITAQSLYVVPVRHYLFNFTRRTVYWITPKQTTGKASVCVSTHLMLVEVRCHNVWSDICCRSKLEMFVFGKTFISSNCACHETHDVTFSSTPHLIRKHSVSNAVV